MPRLLKHMLGPALVVAALLFVLWAMQRRLMYFPLDDVPPPVTYGLRDVESVTFDTADGLRLSAWFFPLARQGPGVTVLVLHGNAGNRAHRAPLASALRRRGFQVLLLDYRGYGGNPGTPSERGLLADARAARGYLIGRRDVDASRLVYFGESLGAAVAAELAAEHPPTALVLRSPFTSMADIGQHHYPWLPVRWLVRDRYDSIGRMPRVRSPLLVILGERDRIVPASNSRRLFAAAAGAPKTLFALPNADHNDFELLAGNAVVDEIVRFLETSVQPE